MEKLIERELKTLEARRETLASDVEAARGKLDAARGALVSGTLDAGKVTAAQSTFTALDEAVDALDARIMDTRAQLAEAERVAELRAEAARGRAREDRRRVLTAEIHALFENANGYLEGVVSTYFSKIAELRREGGEGHFRMPAVLPFDPAVALALNIESRRRERQRSKEASGRTHGLLRSTGHAGSVKGA
jgi:predicted  nucleic acid-binding Zn-ribbon protein